MQTKTMRNDTLDDGGLRYVHKTAGTPFAASADGVGRTMSCFKCGTHRSTGDLEFKRILGRSERICKDGCKK